MKKYLYGRLVESMKKRSKEDLIAEIESLHLLECSDRSFANEVCAGFAGADFCHLFMLFEDLKDNGSDYEKLAELYEYLDKCKDHWRYIMNALTDIKDPSRSSKYLESFKESLSNAKDDNDSVDATLRR